MIRDRKIPAFTVILVALMFPPSQATGHQAGATRELRLVGDAQMVGDRIRLTHTAEYLAGAAWDEGQVAVASGFITQFSFAITEQGGFHNPVDGTDGADGLAFAIQNHAVGAIGDRGEDVGYGGIPNSMVVEFDTWLNHGASPPELHDPDGSHISVHTCGSAPNSADEAYSLGCVSYPELVTVEEHTVKISYEPGTLVVYIDDLVHPVMTVSVNISELLQLNGGQAWMGFTASTGAAFENHEIFDWWIGGPPVPVATVTWGGVKALYR